MIVIRIKTPFFAFTIKLMGLLMFVMGYQNGYAQQQIAQDAYAIFQQSCLICHGPDGAYRETLLIEHNALIEKGSVVPGTPAASELYNRLVTTETAKRMPLGQPQLPAQSINTIRNWILAGAPDWVQAPTTDRDFITPGEILTTIEAHLTSLTPFDRAYARYFTMTHLMNAGEPTNILDEYRKGLNKLINSLSWRSTITNPQPIDPQGTILYIDLRHYEWDVNDAWTAIETEYPYHIGFNAPDQSGLKAQLLRLQQEMKCDIPSIHADWFIAKASLPPLYHDLLSLPLTDRELETRLEVDVIRNLQNAPGVRVWRAGTNNSGVSNNNRVIERHTSQHGAYWKSYDFAGSIGAQNIFTHPLLFTHDGGEVVFNLPNGLQGYYITTAVGSRLDAAPINIVSNPAASDPTVRNGLSCFGCHTEGMKTFDDEVRSVIESNATPAYDKAHALRLYVEQSEIDGLMRQDMDRYRTALLATGGSVDDIEPIARFHEVFQGPIDASYAAAVVGLSPESLLAKIDENIGLQNIGLLALDGGSVKRDTWTSSFRDIVAALDFPERFKPPPVIEHPVIPGSVVHIPDPHLRAAIAEALNKSPNAPIPVQEMGRLGRLEANNRGIRDLTGLQFGTNLRFLRFEDNEISDLSPLASLINLRELWLHDNPLLDLSPVRNLTNLTHLEVDTNELSNISAVRNLTNLVYLEVDHTLVFDISPISGLTNLTSLQLQNTLVSDLSPVAGLINLTRLDFHTTLVTDLSPVAGLINLDSIAFANENLSDLSPLAGLINLKYIFSWGHKGISDISPLAGLTKLETINFCGGNISDLTPLAGLPNLKELYVAYEKVSDISPLASLTGLTRLDLEDNRISDVSPLAGLTNLKWLKVARNNISDLSPIAGLRANGLKLVYHGNPAFPKGGPKIEGPWLWVVLPGTAEHHPNDTDWLSEVSGGRLTEVEVATHGATAGSSVGDSEWTSDRLPPTGRDNILDMMGHEIYDATVYGSVSLRSPRTQQTTMYVGGDRGARVWLNGVLIYERLVWHFHNEGDYTAFFPVTLRQGRNVLLVAVHSRGNGFFGFEPGTDYTVATPGVGYTFSQTPIHTGDTFTLDISAETVFDMAGWQFDIAFAPAILEAINVSEGNFLKTGGTTFFQGGSIDNAVGKITGLSAARLSTQGVTGTGVLLQVRFKAKSGGETELALQNFQFGSVTGESILAGPHQIRIAVEGRLATGDVNRDGVVSILDMILVAQQLGKRVSAGSAADVNGDGVVSILDLIRIAQGIGNTTVSGAPAIGADSVDAAMIEAWLAQARLADDGSLVFKQGIENLQALLRSLIPEQTTLLPNYPNPFNPETWIPYNLAEPADVQLTIYDVKGELVRRLDLGYQQPGYYINRAKAAYWDGRNEVGERVASGLYFYTLAAGDFSATRKTVILK